MTPGTIFLIVPFLLGLVGGEPAVVGQSVARMVVEDEVILRVPLGPAMPPPRLEWTERGGPNCVGAGAIRGAILSGPRQVDFLLAKRGRVRAELDEDCPALDFYGGLYLEPSDGKLCAGRDSVHSRMGGSCTIQRFRQLVPKLRR